MKKLKPTILATAVALISSQTSWAQSENQQAVEELVITGIRGSLKAALDTKRDATTIVDAINSEDIGKFPDKNVADSLQRIPGVSVDRIWGEGRDIFVRGTNSTMNRTLMNGQNVASAYWWANDNASRGFNYSILASELVSSLEVYKSPAADHDEGSIGGMVNVITRRPMDLDHMDFRGSLEYTYSELPEEWDPQVSGLFNWKNEADTFAILASFNSQKRTVRRDGLEAFLTNTLYDITDPNDDSVIVEEDVYAAWGGGSAIFQQERQRDTANITMQFRPTDAWDIVLNFVNSDMDMDNSNQNYLWIIGGIAEDGLNPGDNPRLTQLIDTEYLRTSDGHLALMQATLNDPNRMGAAIEPIVRDAFVKSQVIDLDTQYDADTWRVHVQLGSTSAEGGSDEDVGYWFEANTRTQVALGNESVEVDYLDIDPTDHAALRMTSARDWVRKMEDDETYAQADVEFDLSNDFFRKIKTGLKFRDHTVNNNRNAGATNSNAAAWRTVTMDEVSGGVTPALHGEAATSGSLTRYAWINTALANEVIHPIFNAGGMEYTYDTQAYFEINEEITAAYLRADFEAGKLTGNVGIRAIQTEQTSEAYQDDVLGSETRSYTDVLPSVNLTYQWNDELVLRGAASQAMARPTFTDLSANIVVNATSGVATAGNPNIDSTYANQLEFGAEWYYNDTALLSGTFFYKDLDTYVVANTATEVINGQSLSVTRPSNADDGADLTGLELQWQQQFDNGLGALVNYTWTDADTPNELELPGNSENQINLSGYYENEVLSVRLSYNYRDESYGSFLSGSQVKNEAYGQWDATANWSYSDAITVFFNAVNITNEIVKQSTSDGIPIGFYENGSRFSVGLNLDF